MKNYNIMEFLVILISVLFFSVIFNPLNRYLERKKVKLWLQYAIVIVLGTPVLWGISVLVKKLMGADVP